MTTENPTTKNSPVGRVRPHPSPFIGGGAVTTTPDGDIPLRGEAMSEWKDCLVTATEIYGILIDLMKLELAEEPKTEQTHFRIKQLKAAISSANNLIANINDKIVPT